MLSLVSNFFVDIFWHYKRSLWRYENRKIREGKKPWWEEVKSNFEKVVWKIYPWLGRLRIFLIRFGYKIFYSPGAIRAQLIRLGWRVYALASPKSVAIRLYWTIYGMVSWCRGSLRSGYWAIRAFRAWPKKIYWLIRSKYDQIHIHLIRAYWRVHDLHGRVSVELQKKYWMIYRHFGNVRVSLVRIGYAIQSSFQWCKGYSVRAMWACYNSQVIRIFRKIYWFLEFQIQKRILSKTNWF